MLAARHHLYCPFPFSFIVCSVRRVSILPHVTKAHSTYLQTHAPHLHLLFLLLLFFYLAICKQCKQLQLCPTLIPRFHRLFLLHLAISDHLQPVCCTWRRPSRRCHCHPLAVSDGSCRLPSALEHGWLRVPTRRVRWSSVAESDSYA